MDPITFISTLWEITKDLVIRFVPYDPKQDPFDHRPHHHPNPVSDSERHEPTHHDIKMKNKIFKKLRKLAEKDINPFNNLTPEQNFAILLFGLSIVPASAASASLTFTALTIGSVGEAFTYEILANAAFMQAANRAGAVLYTAKALELNSIFTLPTKIKNVMSHADLKYLKHFSVKNIIHQAERMGLDTPKDSLILWTGFGKEGITISKDFARANGGTTLEMTSGGAWLDKLNLFADNSPFTAQEALEIWEAVSVAAIKRAQGQVRSVVGVIKPRSIYQSELRAIQDNPLITGHDPLVIAPRLVINGI